MGWLREMTRKSLAMGVCRAGVLALGMAVFSSLCLPSLRAQEQALDVVYTGGLLSLSASKADPKEVLTIVFEKTGVLATVPVDLGGSITMRFDRVPLEEGLHRILKGMNYALIFSPSDEKDGPLTLSRVFVFPEGRDALVSRPPSGASIEPQYETEREAEPEIQEGQEIEPEDEAELEVDAESQEEPEVQPVMLREQKEIALAGLQSHLDKLAEQLETVGEDSPQGSTIKSQMRSLESQKQRLLEE